ncbi:hypothetical protein ACTHEV_005167 [Klebsiella pneumoniae]|uniref:hypothetical protein n=1 Tax=Klebsiella pneumoniae TaxID=573 RepID=UPI0010916E71|nr:hypothetical protein [Klebsiella pneumoniae]
MQLEGLQSLRDNQLARLSAVINLSGTQPLENHISYTTPGDTIAVDRSLKPKHDNLVIANVDNELVICKLLLTPVPAVQMLSNQSSITPLNEGAELPIWGVIAYVLTDLAGQGFSQVTSVSQDLSNE